MRRWIWTWFLRNLFAHHKSFFWKLLQIKILIVASIVRTGQFHLRIPLKKLIPNKGGGGILISYFGYQKFCAWAGFKPCFWTFQHIWDPKKFCLRRASDLQKIWPQIRGGILKWNWPDSTRYRYNTLAILVRARDDLTHIAPARFLMTVNCRSWVRRGFLCRGAYKICLCVLPDRRVKFCHPIDFSRFRDFMPSNNRKDFEWIWIVTLLQLAMIFLVAMKRMSKCPIKQI